MNVEFRESFQRDLRAIKDAKLLAKIRSLIESLELAEDIREIRNTKKLRGSKSYYRIRLGDYRIGFAVEQGSIVLVRFLSRKDIYRVFP